MKYAVIALLLLLVIFLLGDYIFYLFAVMLGAATLWCLYRAAVSYNEWQMPKDKWLAKVETEAATPPQKRVKRTKADGSVVAMFLLLSFIPGCLSYQAVNFRDEGKDGSSGGTPAANFTAGSTAVGGVPASGANKHSAVLYLTVGLGFVFLGAAGGIASVALKNRRPKYAKFAGMGAAVFMALGGGCLLLNMTGGGKATDQTAAVVEEQSGGDEKQAAVVDAGGEKAEADTNAAAKTDDGKSAQSTVLQKNLTRQDKDAVKRYIERENPFQKIKDARAVSKMTESVEKSDAAVLKRYSFALAKLSEESLDPSRIIKGAEETAKVYEEFYDSEFLLVIEWQNAKNKKTVPNDIQLAELMKRHEEAEKEIRRLANWSGAKL